MENGKQTPEVNQDGIYFELAQNTDNNCYQVMQWRNDEDTRRFSFHTEVKEFSTYRQEFSECFLFPDLPPLFLRVGNERCGFVSFCPCINPCDQTRKAAEISINLAKEHRGKGFGKKCLMAVLPWIKQQGYDDLIGYIKPGNAQSQKAFLNAGFKQTQDASRMIFETSTWQKAYTYIAELTPKRKHKEVVIIAEAGSNWRMGTPKRDLSMGKVLIDIAKDAGADAVKFQVFHPETLYAASAGSSSYLTQSNITEEMNELFQDLALSVDLIQEFYAYCQSVDIEFMATAFSENDFATIAPFVKRNKIASYELSHIHLLKLAAKSLKPLLLSTGAATEDEIAWSVDTFRGYGGKDLTLLQCTAAYPALPEAMNLRTIPWLQKRFQCEVGLSDHSRHPLAAPVAAIALGATVIEKHFTLDNKLPGPDHSFAILPNELKEMIVAIRQAATMRGAVVKCVAPQEEELRAFARRGIQATNDIKAGDILQEKVNIAILRPGNNALGLHPRYLAGMVGKRATRAIPLGQGLTFEDFESAEESPEA